MIKLKKVTARNFKSFGNSPTSFDLSKQGSTLILGDNQDIGEQGSSKNGVGKSSVMVAVVFALYGKDIEKLRPDELINFKNKKNMVVELEFELRGISYRIVRGRKPNILEFYADGKSLTRDSMKNTDQTIIDVIGIDYDVFLSVYFLNTFRPTFMSLGSASQRDFLEKVLGLDVLANRAEALKLMKKELSIDHKLAVKDLESEERIKEQYDDNVNWVKRKFDSFEGDRKAAYEKISEQIETRTSIDFDKCLELAKLIVPFGRLEELADLNRDLDILESKLESNEHRVRMVEKANRSFDEWIKTHQDTIDSLEGKIAQYPSLEDMEHRDQSISKIEILDKKIVAI